MGARKECIRCINATHVCIRDFHGAVCGTVMLTYLQNQLYYWFLQ